MKVRRGRDKVELPEAGAVERQPRARAPKEEPPRKIKKKYTGGDKAKSASAEKKRNEKAGRSAGAGSFGIHPSALEVPVKPKTPEERLDELQAAFGTFNQRLYDAGYMEDTEEWKAALQALRDAGIKPRMFCGADYDAKLEGAAAYAQKVEWYLGQILAIAEEVPDKRPGGHLYETQNLAPKLKEIEGGRDLLAEYDARDRARERQKSSFISVHKKEGLLQSGYDSYDYRDLFGDSSIVVAKQVGRRAAVLVTEEETGDYRELRGKIGPDPQNRWDWFTVGEQPVCVRHVSAFFVEDTSPVTPKMFSQDAKARNYLEAGSDAFREVWRMGFNAWQMDGLPMMVMFIDKQKAEWVVMEGTLRKDPEARGGAPFLLESGGQTHHLNINDIKKWAIGDTSPISPAEYRKSAEKRGWLKAGSEEHRSLFDAWFRGAEHDGRRATILELDTQAHRYVVTEGVLRPGPHGGWDARYAIEVDGRLIEKNYNDTKEMWLEDTSAMNPAAFAKAMKKKGFEEARVGFGSNIRELVGRPAAAMVIDKKKHEYVTHEGIVRRDPQAIGAALFQLETERGLVELNMNEVLAMWAGRPA